MSWKELEMSMRGSKGELCMSEGNVGMEGNKGMLLVNGIIKMFEMKKVVNDYERRSRNTNNEWREILRERSNNLEMGTEENGGLVMNDGRL